MSEPETATTSIRRLRGVIWKWRDDAPEQAKQQPGMGVIAQEVEAVFPELVTTHDNGHKQVDYDGLIAPLCRAIGELAERLRQLSSERQGGESVSSEDSTEQVAKAARGGSGSGLDPHQVARVFPDLVTTDEEGNEVVAYEGLNGPLIEAIKELDARVSALEGRG